MAENRNITWNVTLKSAKGASNPQSLTLSNSSLSWGKWGTPPPSQIQPGSNASFEAMGASCSATGTEGTVIFQTNDGLATFTFQFDIPYSSANSGGVFQSGTKAQNYQVDGGNVPVSGNSVTVNVTITQLS